MSSRTNRDQNTCLKWRRGRNYAPRKGKIYRSFTKKKRRFRMNRKKKLAGRKNRKVK